ncbi:MAG: restriction endonuclease subunit S [Alistipes sp.]|nr:restriction endonuclease subunit S [Alistipes sp.]
MDRWKKYKIGDICTRICSGGTPKSTESAYYGGNIPWLNTKEINFNQIYKTERCITQSGLDNSSAKWIESDSVIVAMYGATAAKIAINKIPLTTNQACCNLTINKTIADYRYVYYYLCNNYSLLASLANGGAQQNLNAQQIKDFKITLPPLAEQKRIAAILGALDDKIELNRRINANLEEQAKAFYKSWFVDFEPFNGILPNNWNVKLLGEICSCELGGTPNRNISEYWGGNIPWINSGEINQFRITKPSEMISELGLKKSATKLLPPKTIVLAITGATLGQVSLLEIASCTNQSVVSIKPNEFIPYEYIYPYIKTNINKLISCQTGGAQQHINRQNVEKLNILLPDKEIMRKYVNAVSGIYALIANKCFENESLTTLRDTLLPKLMNGEINI